MTDLHLAPPFAHDALGPTLSDCDHEIQAGQFLGLSTKLPLGTPLESTFAEWSQTKDFSPTDREAIFTHVQRLLLERREKGL